MEIPDFYPLLGGGVISPTLTPILHMPYFILDNYLDNMGS